MRRVDVLATADSGATELLVVCDAAVEEICTDLGLSALVLGLIELLRASGTVLIDCVRDCVEEATG